MVDNKENVLEEYLEKAQNGDVDAQFKIAWAYDQGEGVEQNYVEANKWWRESAIKGNKYAQYNLAQNLRCGRGTPFGQTNCEDAEYWYKESAKNGYQKANDRLSELKEELKVLARFEGIEKLAYKANTTSMENYRNICDMLNEVAMLGEPVSKTRLEKAIDEFVHSWFQCLIDELYEERQSLDLLKKKDITDEEKSEILFVNSTYGKMNDNLICNALSKLKNLKCEVANYEKIAVLVNEIAMQWCFSRSCDMFFQNEYIKGDSFIHDKYKCMITALLGDKKDIVALYSRQILNYILKDSYRTKSKRIDWPNKEIDIVKKVEMLERGNYVSKEMIQLCNNIRYSTNLGHHITTIEEWNKWDTISCVESTIQLIQYYLKEVKGNYTFLVETRKYDDKDYAYGLNFWKRNHIQMCFEKDVDLKQYTVENLAVSYLNDKNVEIAIYGRRLLEMWLNEKFNIAYPGYLWPEGKEDIIEKIDFLYSRNIISDIEKSKAHDIRKECNGSMHIESDDDEGCSVYSVYRNVESLINSENLKQEVAKIKKRREDYWSLSDKYSSTRKKIQEQRILKEQKEAKIGFAVMITLVIVIIVLFVCSIIWQFMR